MIRVEITADDLDGAAYQSWLRRRIAALETLQTARIELVDRQKKELDASIVRAQNEIDNLKAQQNIALSPKGAGVTGIAK